MDFDTWKPVYQAIVEDFGYDPVADRRARDLLCELVPAEAIVGQNSLDFSGKSVTVAGGAPISDDELGRTRATDVVCAASDGATVLREFDVTVDLMVTDLDGNPETVRALAREGTPVAIHGHGDNVALLREQVPAILEASSRHDRGVIVPTTQVEPLDPPYNFGGFTDGDRTAFLADALGAESLDFVGWDFDDETVSPEKAKKLEWAQRLLCWLERRREEPFALLDSRRGDIDGVDTFFRGD